MLRREALMAAGISASNTLSTMKRMNNGSTDCAAADSSASTHTTANRFRCGASHRR